MSSPSKKGHRAKIIKFFLGDDGEANEESEEIIEGRFNTLKRILKKSKRAIVVLVFGPSRSGKSTLLNFLTTKNYPFLNEFNEIPKVCDDKSPFPVGGGTSSCTRDFHYAKVCASRFRDIHGLSPESDEFDIFFIDCEGFGNIDGTSANFFIGLFTLMDIASVQIYLDKNSASNKDIPTKLAQVIKSSKILGNEHQPKLISVSRTTPDSKKEKEEEKIDEEDNEDDDDDCDIDDDFDVIPEVKPISLKEKNEMLYENYRKQDKDNKPKFINDLKEKVKIDEDKIEILTNPNCNVIEQIAFKKTLTDLSRMILDRANPREGSELSDRLERAYVRVCKKYIVLNGRPETDSVFSSLLKDYIYDIINEEEKKAINDFNDYIKGTVDKLVEEIHEKFPDDDNVMECIEKPFKNLMDKLAFIIPETGLDDITRDCLEKTRMCSENRVAKEIKALLDLRLAQNNVNISISLMYSKNPSLRDAKPGNIVKVNLIDKDGNDTEKQINVIVLEETFMYEGKKYNYIFPAGIKITKIKKTYIIDVYLTTETTNSTKTEEFDITNGYLFNFLTKEATPKEYADAYRMCIYNYKYTWDDHLLITKTILLMWRLIRAMAQHSNPYTKTIEEMSIIITVDDAYSSYNLNCCYAIEYDNTDPDERTFEDKTLYPGSDHLEITVKAKPHEKHDKTNNTNIRSISFKLK